MSNKSLRENGGVSAMLGEHERGGPRPGSGEGRSFRKLAAEASRELTLGAMAASDILMSQRRPALHEWLCSTMLDGKPVLTATLLVFCEEGRWKACVMDRESDRSFFRSAKGFDELLDALEEALANGTADWRARRGSGRK